MEWRERVLAALDAGDLHGAIRAIDLAWDDPLGEPSQALARAFVAVGPALLEALAEGPAHNVGATLLAAEDFVTLPTHEAYARYESAGTDSYPFGPGEGCHSILADPARHGEPGSGCRSGAGSLDAVAHVLGPGRVIALIRPVFA